MEVVADATHASEHDDSPHALNKKVPEWHVASMALCSLPARLMTALVGWTKLEVCRAGSIESRSQSCSVRKSVEQLSLDYFLSTRENPR